MSAAKTYFKLGVFVLLGLAGLVAAAFGLGVHSLRSEDVDYHSYFDESVQGLDVGAPVKYRGVSIGTVSATEIAPDRRHVDVTLSLKVKEVRRLGLVDPGAEEGSQPTLIAVPPEIRAQLALQGITGVKFVNIDFFDPVAYPVFPLPFVPAERTIPSAPSLVKSFEDSLVIVMDRMPAILSSAAATLERIDLVVAELQEQGIAESVGRTVGNLDASVSELRAAVRQVGKARLPEKTAKAIDNLDLAVAKMGQVLDRLDGDAGLVASTKRATDSMGDLGHRVSGGAGELERTLRDLGEAARSIRNLADALERDPDMLLKGRANGRKR